MPLPLQTTSDVISDAVEAVINKTVPGSHQTAVDSLNASGADIEALACQLANLVYTAKDGVKLNAIKTAFALHGINLEPGNASHAPVINLVINSEKTQVNQMLAPARNYVRDTEDGNF